MDKEDDDISIDFSKVKKFFNRETPEAKSEAVADKNESKIEPAKETFSQKQEKEDDEISIDFSKIKKFFKSDEKEEKGQEHQERHHEKRDSKDDDEISIDFGKIKNIFKSNSKEESKDEDISIDWSVFAGFFKKYGVIFLALIPIILSIYVRMQAGALPIVDNWAESTVINNLKSQVRSSIDQQYPNLPDANKNALVDTQMNKIIMQNKPQIDAQIQGTANYFRSFFLDENGKNYMPDIDPYYWFRYAKNIVDHGHPGDILKEGRPYDTYQLAPMGRFVTSDMFPAFSLAYFYKILHLFSPDLTLMRSMFYYPVFVSALCVLLVFLIGRRIAGNAGGFFAAMMMAINGAFLGRTLFGHADSDGWVVLFPLLTTWLFIVAESSKNFWRSMIVITVAGFFTGLFSYAWTGWWYIFDFLLATVGITLFYMVASRFYEKRSIRDAIDANAKNLFIIAITYLSVSLIFVFVFMGAEEVNHAFFGAFEFRQIKSPAYSTLWPNVLTTVAELNEGSISSIINSIGGQLFFFIALVGLVLAMSRSEKAASFDIVYIIGSALFYGAYFLLAKAGWGIGLYGLLAWIMAPIAFRVAISIYRKESGIDFKLSILLALWMISTIYASIKGIRFTLLLAPAFSVAFGVALGKGYEFLSNILNREFKIHKVIGSAVLIILLMLIYIDPIRAAYNGAGSDIPIVNDAWYNTLNAIKQDSKPNEEGKINAIITSWWDFGHHFKALADRPVTFDGTTQTARASHFVGKLFMTGNETESIAILRMLDCGSQSAYDTLEKITNNPHTAMDILKKIIILDKQSASKKLADYGLDKEDINKVLGYTHCIPPDAYVIASEDMIGKSGVWSHFGSWDFERADIWYNIRGMDQDTAVEYMTGKFNYTRERAENTYYEVQAIGSDGEANTWIAPWPGYGGNAGCTKNENGVFACSNGLLINMSNYDIFASTQNGIQRPRNAAFVTETGLVRKEYKSSTIDFGVTVLPESESQMQIIMSSPQLTGSIFTQLFYMNGHGLRYFKPFIHERGLTGTDIYTYKIDWEGKNATISENFIKKPVNITKGAESDLIQTNNS